MILKPLEGIKVIDLGHFIAGLMCTMMLGDMGAEVIKVGLPDRPDDSRSLGPLFVGGESPLKSQHITALGGFRA